MNGVAGSVVVPAGFPGATKAEKVRAMFARIVPRYDLMNRLMTFGMDVGWRRVAVADALPGGALALDVGTGTGDVARALVNAGARRVVGVDFVSEMLVVARAKTSLPPATGLVWLANADALSLPFVDGSFDCVVNAFILRNLSDISAAIGDMVRVLRPGGRLVCLEITHPPRLLRTMFRLYFGHVVPFMGALVTGEGQAYRYLPASLGPLPEAAMLADIMRMAGLVDVRYRLLGLGMVAVHVGTR